MMSPAVVWFKRDLRVRDHAPLRDAARHGPCVGLYIYEPTILSGADASGYHLSFINDSLEELRQTLAALGCPLITRVGNAVDVLDRLHDDIRFSHLYSHQETGNDLTFKRDIQVGRWVKRKDVIWTEHEQQGVVRRLKTRDGWARQWNIKMTQPIIEAPRHITGLEGLESDGILPAEHFGLVSKDNWQTAGEELAHTTLKSFLTDRGQYYQSEMSSPLDGESGCSRMSPYLAYGNISMKQVYQALNAQRRKLKVQRDSGRKVNGWSRSLASYDKRLHWNGHFIQRLELEPEIEFKNMASSADGLRENDFDQARFDAWCAGQTGYPMVDACMRYVRETGWLNFRMRAMVVSFASYHLWLHWRETALHLARHFTDYEPGIHFSQVQMQSGTTGINSVRMYSPSKQATDQDPSGAFIRRWVPELDGVPLDKLAEPHRMTLDEQHASGCIIGQHYPEPIVDHRSAMAQARRKVYASRKGPQARAESQKIYQRHGSRKRRAQRGPKRPPSKQTSLFDT